MSSTGWRRRLSRRGPWHRRSCSSTSSTASVGGNLPSGNIPTTGNAVVNKASELLDGAVGDEGLIVVGATNRPDHIDEAIKRSGRLETHVEIKRPDVPTLAEILTHHLGDDVMALIA